VLPLKANTPTERRPWVTLALITANLVTYALAIAHGGNLFSGPSVHTDVRYGLTPYALSHGHLDPHHAAIARHPIASWATLFTALFVHASLLHLAGNLLFLWIFGPGVESAVGHVKYLIFYVAGGVAALALQAAFAPHTTSPTVGSAGAIAAVIAAYAVLYPHAKVVAVTFVVLLFTFVEVPLRVVVLLWLALQAVFALTHLTDPLGGGGVAVYFAYVGGLLFGALAIRFLVRRRRPLVNTPPLAPT
jgi:membrane associated rhomboid family serine protease